jgi:RNA polymerase sigma-70 factor (ECF subfamily)
MVHGVLLASVPRREVDDLVQDVFLHAFRRLGSLRDAAAFGAWLARIARNRASDYHRAATPTEQLSEDLSRPTAGGSEALAALEAIRGLPESYRETLTLRLVEGLTGPEIAAQTGLTPDSVRVNLHRGMKLLRERLGWRS